MNMDLNQYFDRFSNTNGITLVGPLYDCRYPMTEPVIFVDGGTNFRTTEIGISVGDGDSSSENLDVLLNPDKDFSDLAYVLEHIPSHFTDLLALGFLGGRKDHELFNFGEVHRFLKSRKAPTRVDFESRIFAYSAGQWQFERAGCFSIAVLEPTLLTLWGDCKYQCNEPTAFEPLSSLGLSNTGHGTIFVQSEYPVFVIFEEFV